MQRSTRQRDAIRTVLQAAQRPLSAGEVLVGTREAVATVGIATVYRNLKLLVEAGEVEAVTLPGGNPHYEMAQLGHHHHFQCTACDRVFDVPECRSDLKKLLPRGFTMDRHELVLYGRCAACAT